MYVQSIRKSFHHGESVQKALLGYSPHLKLESIVSIVQLAIWKVTNVRTMDGNSTVVIIDLQANTDTVFPTAKFVVCIHRPADSNVRLPSGSESI